MSLLTPPCIYDRLEAILFPIGLYLDSGEMENVTDPGIGTYEVLLNSIVPSIDYHAYSFTLTLNFGDNKSRDQNYDLSLDKAIRQTVQVNSLKPGDKGLIILDCSLTV